MSPITVLSHLSINIQQSKAYVVREHLGAKQFEAIGKVFKFRKFHICDRYFSFRSSLMWLKILLNLFIHLFKYIQSVFYSLHGVNLSKSVFRAPNPMDLTAYHEYISLISCLCTFSFHIHGRMESRVSVAILGELSLWPFWIVHL
jgi:hypothetical protein